MLLHCASCGSRSRAELSEMRIEGARLVVTCRICGAGVVAVGWNEGPAPAAETAPEGPAPAESSASEMVGGRLELEEGDEPTRPASPPPGPKLEPQPEPRTEPKPEPKPKPKPRAEPKVERIVVAPARNPMRIVGAASGAVVLAGALLFFAVRTRRTENAVESKAAESIPAATPAARPAPSQAIDPAALAATPEPTPGVRGPAPAPARPAPQKPTPKVPAAAAVQAAATAPPAVTAPGLMSESQALSSGLVDAEEFQDRAGKVMTNVLFCRNLEMARNPGVALGALDVSLVVSPAGAVSEVRLERASTRPSLAQCLRDHLGKLQFPGGTARPVEIRRHVDAAEARTAP